MVMEPTIESQCSAPGSDDAKLQLLQLQCIIDAKDREIQLLRKQLSSPEDSDGAAPVHAEIIQLRAEVQRLKLGRNAVHAQPPVTVPRSPSATFPKVELPAGSQRREAAMPRPSSHATTHAPPASTGGAPAPVSLSDNKLHPVSPTAGMTLDPAALVEKLRAVVNGLVAEALAAQLRPVGLSPPGPFFPPHAQPHPQQPQVSPRAGTIGSPFSVGQAKSSAYQASSAWPPACQAGVDPEQYQTIAPPPLTGIAPPPPSVPAPAAMPGGMRLGLPGVQIVVQYPLLAPSGVYQTVPAVAADMCTGTGLVEAPSVVGAGSRTAVAAPASMGGCGENGGGGSAPAVLELNIDGTVVLVERAVLDGQAAGSRLYRALIQEYDKLPRDSQGRPYLSYDPRVFQVLMSYLKERHLFGNVAGEWDWSRTANSLGVSYHYLAQMAAHFGLADPSTQPQTHRDSLPVAAHQQAGQAAQADGATCGPPPRNGLLGQPCEGIPSVHVGTSPQDRSGPGALASASGDHSLPQLTSGAERLRVQVGGSGGDSQVQVHRGAAEEQPRTSMAVGAGNAAAAGAAEGATESGNGRMGVHANGVNGMGSGRGSESVPSAESLATTLPLPPSLSSCPPEPQPQHPQRGTPGWLQPFPGSIAAAPFLAVLHREHVDAAAAEASATAAMAAAAERYRVPNLYEVLAKKQRTELENEARASV